MERMPTLEIGWNKGFTLIELIVVIFLLGIASSYIILNTSILESLQNNQDSLENKFIRLSEESMLSGRTINWHASIDNDQFYNLSDNRMEPIDIGLRFNFLNQFPGQTKILIKTGDGQEYLLDADVTTFPLITFFPSGENSGALINIVNSQNEIQINIQQNGEIFTSYE